MTHALTATRSTTGRDWLLLLAACLTFAAAPSAFAQNVAGSGVVPATIANSAERPIAFAASAPAGGALVVVMTDAALPPLDG